MQILQQIVEILVGGITQFGSGLAKGINDFVQALMVMADGGLSAFGTFIAVFGGIGIVTGITYFIVNWLRSLGN